MCLIDPFRVLFSWLFVHVSKLLGLDNTVLQEQGYREVFPEEMEENGREITLELNKGQDSKGSLFQIRKGDTVSLRPKSTLYGYKIKFLTELPEKGERFIRGKYRHVSLTSKLEASHPGSFHYYTLLDDSKEVDSEGYILVQPVLTIDNNRVPLDCIQCVTYISKYLGKLSTWKEKLLVAHETCYNMVHFTPIQELGGSQSAYCLKDQLSVNSSFSHDGSSPNVEEISELIKTMKEEWKMLSISDIVLNHTANESPWLQEHPECAYNLENSPHLKPAYLVDAALYQFSLDVAQDHQAMNGIPAAINCEDHLNALRHQLGDVIFPKLNIPEMFMVDTQSLVDEFQRRIQYTEPCENIGLEEELLKIHQDPEYRRLKSTVELDLAIKIYNTFRSDCFDEDTRRRRCIEAFKTRLDNLNNGIKWQVEGHLRAAVDNVIASVRYFRLDDGGPKIPKVTEKDLLVPRYFVEPTGATENSIYSNEAKYIMAHNGWMFNADPLKNFAEPGTQVYLRRELIAWGDSVKLRYGDKPEDCPFLWNHMKSYVETTASIFDGVRIDNCHSTPIPVAQYFLDAARLINPNLYVVAELFTDTEQTDNIFVNKLGITSLIREAMSAWDSHELGRLVYRYGGDVIGAFGDPKPLKIAHAMFMDLTHDNPSPHDKRTVFDLLPSAALVSMASCCVGSTMGYDQLVPHHIDVVKESREYMNSSQAWKTGGIMEAKGTLNRLHFALAKDGFSQVFVDQIDKDIVCVTRHNPSTLESVVLFSYTSFSWPNHNQNGEGKGITVSGIVKTAVLEAYLTHTGKDRFAKQAEFQRDTDVINGLSEYKVCLRENFSIEKCDLLKATPAGQSTRLNLTKEFKPGCVVAVRIVARKDAKEAAKNLLATCDYSVAVRKLDFPALNFALYRCPEEDEASSYNVPNYGNLVYCGLQGAMSVLNEIAKNDDLGHPLCGNIREGPWLGAYTANRLKKHPKLLSLGEMITKQMAHVDELPVSLRPWGTYRVLSQAHSAVIKQALKMMPEFIREGNDFAQALALCSIQLAGIVRSSPLPPLSSSISPPHPDTEVDEQGNKKQLCVSLAAGLPHFAAGYMRSWGRDTFISLRGLLLLTGHFNEARYHILAYGGCLRHGLIPNLLDGFGMKPRFNCRDAVWWWLHSIKEYVQLAPNGYDILKDKVNRLFPTDDSELNFTDQELQTVMQEALSVHFQGLCFRERNAGRDIDEHMTSPGFDNQIGVHPATGFVFGGNEWNCGTWMDKMGSSSEAGNKGRPATPRDGSPVEIIGLSMAVISWLDEIHIQGHYPFGGVSRKNKNGTTTWTWSDWSSKIHESFEQQFWVGTYDQGQYVNRRNIYKDTVGATQPWADYRLRPNYLVSMVVAPQMFKKDNAKIALSMAKILLGPLGMKTLDPTDLAYRGDYDNNNRSTDYSTAHGFNYHQGPEWLWPIGYYLRALLKFSDDPRATASEVEKILSRHWAHIESSHWRGLPELTNKDGAFCGGSCPTQAWSAATILETLMDIHLLRNV